MKALQSFCIIALILFSQSLRAVDFQWQTFTSYRKIRRMIPYENTIWCATEGGVVAYNMETHTYTPITNTEGLADIDVNDLVMDSDSRIWIGMRSGYLQALNPATKTLFTVEDYIGHEITCLEIDGDSLWVGLDMGVSLYLISRQEVKETYRRLGVFQVERAAGAVSIYHDSIWVSTKEGIAAASLAGVNLLDPNSWTNVLFSTVVADEQLPTLTWAGQELFIVKENRVYQLLQGGYTDIHDNLSGNIKINQLIGVDSTLYLATQAGIYQRHVSGWQRLHSQPLKTYDFFPTDPFSLIGTSNGIAFYESTNDSLWIAEPNCPGSNYYTDLAVDDNGVLWCTTSQTDAAAGIFKYENGIWTLYSKNTVPVFVSNDYRTVAVDGDNNKWFGSWGGGVVKLSGDTLWEAFHPGIGYLSGIGGDPDYAPVPDIAYDPVSNSVWILNSETSSGNGLVSVMDDTIWTYYGASENFPVSNNNYRVLAVDQYGRKWFGTSTNNAYGVRVYTDNGTPGDKSDDVPLRSLTRNDDNLQSDIITALALDHDGLMWIGTAEGIHYWPGGPDGGVEYRLYYLPSDYVRDILVDGANNIWVAHDLGISVRMNRDYHWENIHKENSHLVSNAVQTMTFDPNSGLVYIGTNKGLSCAQTVFSEPLSEPEPLFVYPNPFRPAKHKNLVIDKLAKDVEVGIFTLAGFRVRYFNQDVIAGRQLVWDGTNDAGNAVASGVYIVVSGNEDGEKRLGKITLIR